MSADAERVWLLLQRFVDTHSRHRAMADALGFSLGAGRGKVLTLVAGGPLPLTELARRTGLDAPYTTRVVDDLQRLGLVERGPDPADGRRKLVTLTAAGGRALTTVDDIRREPPPPLHDLGLDDLRTLAAVLERMVGT